MAAGVALKVAISTAGLREGSSRGGIAAGRQGIRSPRLQAWGALSRQQAEAEQLTAQLGRLSEYASREKLIVSHSVAEIGSDLNGHRPKLMKLLKNKDVSAIVVEHRDRV
jgi:hypothetical protein